MKSKGVMVRKAAGAGSLQWLQWSLHSYLDYTDRFFFWVFLADYNDNLINRYDITEVFIIIFFKTYITKREGGW